MSMNEGKYNGNKGLEMRNKRTKKRAVAYKRIQWLSVFVLGFLLLQELTVFAVHASEISTNEDVQTVRVGVFQSPAYYGEDNSGENYGYGYAYLRELEAVSNLRFEFVHGTREEHLEGLQNGTIDLLDTIPYTIEYENSYLFSNLPTAQTSGTLVTLSSNTQYSADDLLGMEGIRVGLLDSGDRSKEFEAWAQTQGLGFAGHSFTDALEMYEAMIQGEIDALISDDIYYEDSQVVLASFNPQLFYFITTQDKRDIMMAVDDAMSYLQEEQPLLRTELSVRYLGSSSDMNALTEEELSYLGQNANTPLRVVYDSEQELFEYHNEEENGPAGLTVDVFEAIMDNVGIPYEYIHRETEDEALQALESGEADIMLSHSITSQLEEGHAYTRSVPYLDVPVALVGKNEVLTENSVFTLQDEDSVVYASYLEEHFPNNEIQFCPTEEDCYNTVQNGADVYTLENILDAGTLVHNGEYGELITLSTRLTDNYALLFSPDMDETAISIINKNIRGSSGQVAESALLGHMSTLNEVDTISQWWSKYGPYVLGGGVLGLLAIVITLLYMLQRQKKLRKELWESAYIDPLTKLPNLRYFKKEAKKKLAQNKQKQYLAIQVDFNQFSLLNDIYGQEEGNEILKTMSEALSAIVKEESDVVARLRADNFLLLYAHEAGMGMDDLHERDAGQVFAYMEKNSKRRVSYCIGRYQVPLGETNIDDICEKVNYAHRQAKRNLSVGPVVDYEEAEKQRALRNRHLEEKMDLALKNEDFLVYLQPKYSLITGKIVGAETLVRWKDSEEESLISPAEFIPLFEQNGFVVRLDFYMFEHVCKILEKRLEDGLPIVPISVNFSRLHLQTNDLVQNIASVADRYNVPRRFLEIELVESTVVDNEEVLENVLKELHEYGFTLSIDDFGTGYSSLGLLKNLPVDVIKIDRSFFANSRSKLRAKTVISNVVRMAKELNIHTVAEGVETQEHVNFLSSLGCESVQGFYFSRPVPVDEFDWGECGPVPVPRKAMEDTLTYSDMGDVDLGRTNLGELMPVMVHRQLEFSMREVLEGRYGERETVEIMRDAGKMSGRIFAEGYLDLQAPFDDFIKEFKARLLEQKIGDLHLEEHNSETGLLVLTVTDDLTCSGVSDTRRTLCHYEEGFLAGVMQVYMGKPYTALEVDCWGNGAELCRFRVRPNSDAGLQYNRNVWQNEDETEEDLI